MRTLALIFFVIFLTPSVHVSAADQEQAYRTWTFQPSPPMPPRRLPPPKSKFLSAILLRLLLFSLPFVCQAERFYVDHSVEESGDGSTWANAFQQLQDALDQTVSGRGDEVWIAAGTYYPDEGANVTDADRDATFLLKDEVSLLGGFEAGATSLDDRDFEVNRTILSGEIYSHI